MNYGLLNHPLLNLGAGLLAAGQSPGGTLGQGLQLGLNNAMRGQQFAQQQKLMGMKMAEYEREQKQRQAAEQNWREFMGTPTVNTPIQPGSNAEFENFDNPNYQGGVSGGLLSTPGTGLSAQDPGMAQMLGLLGPERGSELVGQMMLENMKSDPVTPYSSIGKLQGDLAAGRITPEQYEMGLKNMAPSGMSIEMTEDGGFRFVQGPGAGSAMTSSATTDTQKDVINSLDTLNRLDSIKDQYSRDYMTYGGNAKYFALKQASKMGATLDKESKDFLQGATKFRNQVEQFFNQYRKEITGAAASVQELELLKKSMLNSDMGPDEFEAAYQAFRDTAEKQIAFKQRLLKEGVPVKQIYKRIDAGEWRDEQVNGSDAVNQGGPGITFLGFE